MLKDYLVTAVDDLEVTYQNVVLGGGEGVARSIGAIYLSTMAEPTGGYAEGLSRGVIYRNGIPVHWRFEGGGGGCRGGNLPSWSENFT